MQEKESLGPPKTQGPGFCPCKAFLTSGPEYNCISVLNVDFNQQKLIVKVEVRPSTDEILEYLSSPHDW